MLEGAPWAAIPGIANEPNGTIRNLTVENIAIIRTNGAPAPNSRIYAKPGTSFGSLKISNVTLDGVAIER